MQLELEDLTRRTIETGFEHKHDIRKGMLDNAQSVAIKTPRCQWSSCNTVEEIQGFKQCVLRRMENVAALKHNNIVSPLGYCFGSHGVPSSVIPYFQHGDIIAFLRHNPRSAEDRLNMIIPIAEALAFVLQNFPHIEIGQVRASNILIREDETSVLSLPVSSFVLQTSMQYPRSLCARWAAPELLSPEDEDADIVFTAESTVWSFAMAIFEIMTGERPFREYPRSDRVVIQINKGKIPRRPGESLISESLWALLTDCWQRNPKERPSMSQICSRLKEIKTKPVSTYLPRAILPKPVCKRRSSRKTSLGTENRGWTEWLAQNSFAIPKSSC